MTVPRLRLAIGKSRNGAIVRQLARGRFPKGVSGDPAGLLKGKWSFGRQTQVQMRREVWTRVKSMVGNLGQENHWDAIKWVADQAP